MIPNVVREMRDPHTLVDISQKPNVGRSKIQATGIQHAVMSSAMGIRGIAIMTIQRKTSTPQDTKDLILDFIPPSFPAFLSNYILPRIL